MGIKDNGIKKINESVISDGRLLMYLLEDLESTKIIPESALVIDKDNNILINKNSTLVNLEFDNIFNKQLLERQIKDNAITTKKINDNSIITNKIFDEAVTTAKLEDNSVINRKIADNAITKKKIADGSITLEKLLTNSVNGDKVVEKSITYSHLVQGPGSQIDSDLLDGHHASYFASIEKHNKDLLTKVDKVEGKNLSDNNFNNALLSKLNGIDALANKYIHPSTHSADIITETTNKKFINNVEKTNLINLPSRLNTKVDKISGKSLSTNDYINAEKNKLNSLLPNNSTVVFNKKQAVGLVLENRTSDPVNPVVGQIWIRTDL